LAGPVPAAAGPAAEPWLCVCAGVSAAIFACNPGNCSSNVLKVSMFGDLCCSTARWVSRKPTTIEQLA
jgi:hypothetical protein